MTRAFVASGTATQPQRYMVGDGDTVDECQASGAWLSIDADSVAEVQE